MLEQQNYLWDEQAGQCGRSTQQDGKHNRDRSIHAPKLDSGKVSGHKCQPDDAYGVQSDSNKLALIELCRNLTRQESIEGCKNKEEIIVRHQDLGVYGTI